MINYQKKNDQKKSGVGNLSRLSIRDFLKLSYKIFKLCMVKFENFKHHNNNYHHINN